MLARSARRGFRERQELGQPRECFSHRTNSAVYRFVGSSSTLSRSTAWPTVENSTSFLRSRQMAARSDHEHRAYRPGQLAAISGIYTVVHLAHRTDHEVVA